MNSLNQSSKRNIIAFLKSDEIPASFSEELRDYGYLVVCLQTLEFDFEKYAEEVKETLCREVNMLGGVVFPSKRAVEALDHVLNKVSDNVREFYLNVCYS